MLMMRNHLGGSVESDESLRMSGWQKNQRQQQTPQATAGMGMEQNGVGVGGELYLKVMTDEQMELLRRQIAVYATICEQLVEMHKAVTAQQDLAGMRLGNLYCDPMMTSATHKINARQRWTPTPVQLQILESLFEQGNGTPNKHKIKEITIELSQHGHISETNVYNWFQNRRARSKRKQLVGAPSSTESEAETEVESPKDKKTMPENIQSQKNSSSGDENLFFSNPKMCTETHCLETDPIKGDVMFQSERDLGSSSASSDLGIDHFMGKMEIPGGFSPYQLGEGYELDMVG